MDLSQYQFTLRSYMPGVAGGRIAPETVALLAGRIRTLDAVAQLPIQEQRRLTAGEPIAVRAPDGAVVSRSLADLTWTEAARVIRDGRILTPAEQELTLRRMSNSRARRRSGRPPRVAIDGNGLTLRVGTHEIPMERLLAALRAHGYEVSR